MENPEKNKLNEECVNDQQQSTVLSNDVICELNHENPTAMTDNDSKKSNGDCAYENTLNAQENSNQNVQISCATNESKCDTENNIKSQTSVETNGVVVKAQKPLCADYRSDTDSDSVDSESDSSTSTSDTSSSSDSEYDSSTDSGTVKTEKLKKKKSRDLSLTDLPPIEDLKISVPEDECVEIGTITSIVDTLVVVESFKGSAALDVDTVLFLDEGKRALGKIFEVLGPVSEPVYSVRFNSKDHITEQHIEIGMKVYYAPKTDYTSFVFLSEIMKIRGSDASWKHNIEAPIEYQEFSDDDEEAKCQLEKTRGPNYRNGDANVSRKRSFRRATDKSGKIIQSSRFRNPSFQQGRFPPPGPRYGSPRPPLPHRNPFAVSGPPSGSVPQVPGPAHHAPPVPYGIPPYPGSQVFAQYPPQPHVYYTPRFSGPPFPTFAPPPYSYPPGGFHQPFFQQRTRGHVPSFGAPWMPPPPPPPPAGDASSSPQVLNTGSTQEEASSQG